MNVYWSITTYMEGKVMTIGVQVRVQETDDGTCPLVSACRKAFGGLVSVEYGG